MSVSIVIGPFLRSLNNREIAILIWLGTFAVFALSVRSVRDSFGNLFKRLIEIHISLTLFTLFVYVSLEASILGSLSLWDYTLLKDTIIWILFVAIGLIMNLADIKFKDRQPTQFFKDVLWSNFKFILALEFIVNLYAFNLLLENFSLGAIAVIALMGAVAGTDKKYGQLKKVCNFVLSVYGISVLIFSILKVFTDFGNFATFETLKSFLLPLLLTMLYIPYLYVLSLVFAYEAIFIRLDVFFAENQRLRRFAKIQMIRTCLLNVNRLHRIQTEGMLQLMRASKEEDVVRIVNIAKRSSKQGTENV